MFTAGPDVCSGKSGGRITFHFPGWAWNYCRTPLMMGVIGVQRPARCLGDIRVVGGDRVEHEIGKPFLPRDENGRPEHVQVARNCHLPIDHGLHAELRRGRGQVLAGETVLLPCQDEVQTEGLTRMSRGLRGCAVDGLDLQ